MKKTILYVLFLFFTLSFFYSKTTLNSSLDALHLWLNTLVPSFLFPLIFIRLLAPYHLLYPLLKYFDKPLRFIFHINAYTFESILTSLFLGFPSSSLFLETLSNSNILSQKQYNRLLYSVFLASPNFILISLNVIYPTSIIQTLLIIQCCCVFSLLFFTRKTPLYLKRKNIPIAFFPQLKESITISMQILLMILAYLLIIYVLIDLTTLFTPPIIKTPLKLLSEFASGCFYISTMNLPFFYKYLLTSIILSYGGLCVHMQIITSLSKSKFQYTTFLKYRIVHIVLSILFTYLLLG